MRRQEHIRAIGFRAVGIFLATQCVVQAIDMPPRKIAWSHDCSSSDDWLSNDIDPAIGTRVEPAAEAVMQVPVDSPPTAPGPQVRAHGSNTAVAQAQTLLDSVLRITQDGRGTWGKSAIKVEGIDINRTPVLEVKVNKVDLDSGFQVAVAPLDWSEMPVVINRTSAHGIHQGDIRKVIRRSKNPSAWNDGTSFYVVFIVEGKGKSIWVDYLRVQSER